MTKNKDKGWRKEFDDEFLASVRKEAVREVIEELEEIYKSQKQKPVWFFSKWHLDELKNKYLNENKRP